MPWRKIYNSSALVKWESQFIFTVIDNHALYIYICDVETWTRRTYPKRFDDQPRQLVMKTCHAYTPAEAEERSITYYEKYEDIPLGGDGWFKTDDGWIVHCFKRERIRDYPSTGYLMHRFHTDLGQWCYAKKEGNVTVRPTIQFHGFKANGYRPLYTKNDYIRKLNKPRLMLFVKAYVAMILKGERVDYEMLGRIMERKHWNYRKYALNLIKTWEVKEMISKELLKQFEAEGVTLKSTITKFEEAYAIAKAKKDAQTMTRVAENFLEVFVKSAEEKTQDPASLVVDYTEVSNMITAAEGRMSGDEHAVERKSIEAVKSEVETFEEEQVAYAESINELMTIPSPLAKLK